MARKDVTVLNGLALYGKVRILQGPDTPKVHVVRHLGVYGFMVKERVTIYRWEDKGTTWEPPVSSTIQEKI
jgi:hypothetical protein